MGVTVDDRLQGGFDEVFADADRTPGGLAVGGADDHAGLGRGAVGAAEDRNTTTIADDKLAHFSAYGTVDCQIKPDLVAPDLEHVADIFIDPAALTALVNAAATRVAASAILSTEIKTGLSTINAASFAEVVARAGGSIDVNVIKAKPRPAKVEAH